MRKSSAISAVLKLKLLFGLSILLLAANVVPAQRQQEQFNSPLYSPKVYDPSQTTSNGLPPALQKVGIEQNLNGQLPLDTEFKNENGETVKLGDYFGRDKPVILALVYYECPMLCNEVLNGLTGSLKAISLNAGKDFDVVAISFDARENEKQDLAKNKKASYVDRYSRAGTDAGWNFLTGTQDSIDKITQAVGFNYVFDEKTNQFAHAGGFVVTTPEGKLSRYFYGVDFAPKDVKLALLESGQNKIGTPVDKLLLYCFHYDPASGTYGFAVINAIRAGGVLTMLGFGAMLFVFWRRKKRKEVFS